MEGGDGVLTECPRCGGSEVVPVVYGLLDEAGMAAARAGRIAAGGCLLPPPGQERRWRYRDCEALVVRQKFIGLAVAAAVVMEWVLATR